LGRNATKEEYLEIVSKKVDPFADELYRYLNFNEIPDFEDEGRVIPVDQMPRIEDILGMPTGAK
ncbi:MAG: hypothetical protein F6K09_29860, partial [Merismopedia sp. SIO2A8]|nr:hypothetical protein [Merismopedia sp. SIO2A8]